MNAAETNCPTTFEFVESRIEIHRQIAKDTWQLTIESPSLARRTMPGQFFMLRIANRNDPLIGRAFALYDRHRDREGKLAAISIVYTVKGKFTQALSKCLAGERVDLWGPLGNSFSTSPTEHLILVAGGVGQTPMLSYASSALGLEHFGTGPTIAAFASRVTLCYGARSKEHLAGLSDFQRRCSQVRVATEDGSMGHHGRVTDVLSSLLDSFDHANPASCRIACCGPEPMMEAVSKIACDRNLLCEVSLETPMACGIGVCYTCVAKIKQPDGQWDYKRTCVEGPIFNAIDLVWH